MKPWRVISVIGSVLFILLLIAFATGLVGYFYLNQQLKAIGVTDWQIEIDQLTANHIVIERLEITIDSLPQSTTDKPPIALNLTQLLSTEVPGFLPERIEIKSLHLKGTLLPEKVSASLTLLNREQLRLHVNSSHPVAASLEISRNNEQIQLQADYDSAELQASYDFHSGQLKAKGNYVLAAQEFADTIGIEQLPVNAQWLGHLSPEIAAATPEEIVSALTGELLLSNEQPATIKIADSTTTATGQFKLDLSNGSVNSYRLKLDGETEALASLTDLALPVKLGPVSWHLKSSDCIALPLLNPLQAAAKTDWPIQLNAAAKGKNNESIDISSELNFRQNQWQFSELELVQIRLKADTIKLPIAEQTLTIDKLTSSFSGRISTHSAELRSIEPTDIQFNILDNDVSASINFSEVNFPFSEPAAAFAGFDLNLNTDAINVESFPKLKADLNGQFEYRQQQLTGIGELILGDHIKIKHQSQINASQLKSNLQIADFNWQQLPELNKLLERKVPQLAISKAAISGQTDLSLVWNSGRWQLDNGHLNIKESDWIADTLSVVNSSLNFEFSGNNEQLAVESAKLDIGSIQQGFAIGPVSAEFALQLPVNAPLESTLNLTSHSIKGLGGSITVPNQRYSLANSFSLPVVFEGISLGELMRQYPSNKISIDGEVSGTLPIKWDSKQLTVERGYLNALAPGGHLQVDSSALVAFVGSNPSLQTLAGVLGNFYYQQLSTVVDYDKDGKLTLGLALKGSNPELENGRAVELNVTLEEDLPALIKGLQLSNSLNDVIRKRVQQKIK